MRRKQRAFVPLSDILPKALKARRSDKKILLYDLEAQWETLVGQPLARRSAPLKIRGKRLIVGVEGSAWAAELSLFRETLLERIRATLPHVPVDEIRFQNTSRSSGGRGFTTSPDKSLG